MRLKNVLSISGVILFAFSCSQIQTRTGQDQKPVEVTPRLSAPITFPVPAGWIISTKNLALEAETGEMFDAQIGGTNSANQDFASAVVPVSLLEQNTFQLKRSTQPVSIHHRMHWNDDQSTTISMFENDRLVFQYHYGTIQPPEGVPSHRARSSYFHPILGLDGETFTEDFPADHYHHRGYFFAWPGIFLGDQRYDMWHIIGIRTIFERVLAMEEGPVFALLTIQNGWYTNTRKVMDEICEIKVWKSDGIGQALDIRYIWTPLEPIKIGPKDSKGYGGVNFRFPSRQNTVVTNIDGIQTTSDLLKSPWVDLSGRFENRESISGVTIMNHPSNLEPNPGWIIRSADDYGFIGISWPGIDTFEFQPGNTYQNLYRFWLHRGDINSGYVKEAFSWFASPKAPALRR